MCVCVCDCACVFVRTCAGVLCCVVCVCVYVLVCLWFVFTVLVYRFCGVEFCGNAFNYLCQHGVEILRNNIKSQAKFIKKPLQNRPKTTSDR